MYLRRLEVHGFKAFADRQRFEFGPGMTVIAGPNGSGKSNVADAIRWALGEQSAKQIRARKTEDVIFSGPLAGDDLKQAFADADLMVLPTIADGWGLVLSESVASGTPFVSTPYSGAPEIISQTCAGVIFDPLAGAGTLANAIRDAALEIGSLRRNARDYSARDWLSWDRYQRDVQEIVPMLFAEKR